MLFTASKSDIYVMDANTVSWCIVSSTIYTITMSNPLMLTYSQLNSVIVFRFSTSANSMKCLNLFKKWPCMQYSKSAIQWSSEYLDVGRHSDLIRYLEWTNNPDLCKNLHKYLDVGRHSDLIRYLEWTNNPDLCKNLHKYWGYITPEIKHL